MIKSIIFNTEDSADVLTIHNDDTLVDNYSGSDPIILSLGVTTDKTESVMRLEFSR